MWAYSSSGASLNQRESTPKSLEPSTATAFVGIPATTTTIAAQSMQTK